MDNQGEQPMQMTMQMTMPAMHHITCRDGCSNGGDGGGDINVLRCKWDTQGNQKLIPEDDNCVESTCMDNNATHPSGSNGGIPKSLVVATISRNFRSVETWMGACTSNHGNCSMDSKIYSDENVSKCNKSEFKLLAENCERRTETRTQRIRKDPAVRTRRQIKEICAAVEPP